jgi:hypothetical protein
MKLISLTQGFFAQVSDHRFEYLNQFSWQVLPKSNTNYAVTTIKGVKVRMPRLIMGCVKDDGKQIDHIDNNGLNNMDDNLRFSTPSQNMMNKVKQKGTLSKYKGVCFETKINGIYKYEKWVCYIFIDKKRKRMGWFPFTEEGEIAAAKKYNEAAIKHYGEFAKLNVI